MQHGVAIGYKFHWQSGVGDAVLYELGGKALYKLLLVVVSGILHKDYVGIGECLCESRTYLGQDE